MADQRDSERDRYDRLVDEVMRHYEAEHFEVGLAVTFAGMATLPTYRSDIAHLSACLRGRAGDQSGALKELQDVLRHGGWWQSELLTDDDDLAGLRSLDGFDELVAESHRRWEAARQAYVTSPPIISRPSGQPRGVVVALHGAAQDAERAAEDWAGAVDAGWILLTLDSSQRSTPSYRTWPDQSIAANDVADALAHLADAEQALPVVAGGFSAGGRAALLWAATGQPSRVAGVISVAPAVQGVQLGVGNPDLRGAILIGTEDDLVDGAREAAELLPGVSLEVIDGLGHVYPPDFAERLSALLREIAP